MGPDWLKPILRTGGSSAIFWSKSPPLNTYILNNQFLFYMHSIKLISVASLEIRAISKNDQPVRETTNPWVRTLLSQIFSWLSNVKWLKWTIGHGAKWLVHGAMKSRLQVVQNKMIRFILNYDSRVHLDPADFIKVKSFLIRDFLYDIYNII